MRGGKQKRNRGKGSQVMSAPRNWTVAAGLSREPSRSSCPSFPFGGTNPGALSRPRAGPRGGSAETRRPLRAEAGPRPGPLSRYPGGCHTRRPQGALGQGRTDVPSLTGRSRRPLQAAGQRREPPGLSAPLPARPLSPGSAPQSRRCAPREARGSQLRQTPDTAARPLASAASPAPPAAATQGAARPAGRL